jgi:hypothetical protein
VFSETPLHATCTSGKSLDLVSYLLKQPGMSVIDDMYVCIHSLTAGVDANHQGQDGHTPLHSASYHGHIHVVQVQYEGGVRATHTDWDYFNYASRYYSNTVPIPHSPHHH